MCKQEVPHRVPDQVFIFLEVGSRDQKHAFNLRKDPCLGRAKDLSMGPWKGPYSDLNLGLLKGQS